MTLFKSCRSIPEVKEKYKELAKKHHPDLGGDTAMMREIIKEYKEILIKGLVLRTEDITPEDVDSYFDDVAEVMDYEDDLSFVDMDCI